MGLYALSQSVTLSAVSHHHGARFPVQLAVLAIVRTVVNTGLRMVYPFAPALARGVGVELTTVYNLITVRNFAGFLSPLSGPLSERFGRKSIMVLSLFMFGACCLVVVIWPALWPLGLTLVAIGVAKVIFDPAMQAYVGDTVPYARRGRAFAITELSWAGALLLGAPAVGLAIQQQGWQAPFLWLAALGVISAALLWRTLPSESRRLAGRLTLSGVMQVVVKRRVVWAAAAYTMLAMAANETFFIVYGDWMEGSFDLQLASLGLASSVIGGAEIAGELFAGWSVDRFGKRPIVVATALLNALLYLIIPYTSTTLQSALVSLFILFLTFEITVVGAVPLISEIVPSARTAVMATVLAFGALGRTLGDIVGPRIWNMGGLSSNGLVAMFIMVGAALVLWIWVREEN